MNLRAKRNLQLLCIAAVTLALGMVSSPILSATEEAAKDASDVVGICGRCHEEPVALALETGGHADGVICTDCHRDRRPGRFGRRHRTIVSCASHHDSQGHPKRRAKRSVGRKRKLIRNCITCHEQHGSTNASLVRQTIRTGRRQIASVRFDNEQGAGPGGFTNPTAAGRGVCEICHRKTSFYRRNGGGISHFDVTCTLCHKHGARFEPIIGEENCTDCHTEIAVLFAKTSLHSANLSCDGCHDQLLSSPGSGHRGVPDCNQCHPDLTHGPPGIEALACTRCHEPHGTDNIKLVRQEITTLEGETHSVDFREDRGFVSATEPGSGICEVCHTTTRFFRDDGTGGLHALASCPTCHEHTQGFVAGVGSAHPLPGEDSLPCDQCHVGPTHPPPGEASLECAECHSEQSCSTCHAEIASSFERASLHQTKFPACVGCHEKLSSLGPGHRRLKDCTDGQCHATATHTTHAPPAAEAFPCTRCHDPHGTDNIKLVRSQVTTLQNEVRAIDFGKDRGFVSASEPGSGICEVCHTATRFFRNDGSGDQHADFSCTTCHQHSKGFAEGTHVGPGNESFPCTLCHEPHARENPRAVASETAGLELPKALGGFASAAAPALGIFRGRGARTRPHSAEGSGAPRFAFSGPVRLYAATKSTRGADSGETPARSAKR